MRVVTVTPHPAVDQTVRLDGPLRRGAVQRAASVRENPGGKGVNVASCLADRLGPGIVVAGWLGRDNAGGFDELFRAKGLADVFVRVPGCTRTNVKIVDDHETTDLNLPGPPLPSGAFAALETRLGELAGAGAEWFVLSGSLPEGCPPDAYARWTQRLSGAGAKVVVDAGGEVLRRVLSAPTPPFAIKPNREELEAALGVALDAPDARLAAARRVCAAGTAWVVVSDGGEGALFVTAAGALRAWGEAARVAGTVGAGDALVAGLVAAFVEGLDLEGTARLATAFALVRLATPSGGPLDRDAVAAAARRVEIELLPGGGG